MADQLSLITTNPPETDPEAAQQERFYGFKEIQKLPSQDRDALFMVLRKAQQGDQSALEAVLKFAYEERPVPIDEFVLGRRYLNLRGLINSEKIDILERIDHPRVRHVFMAVGSGGGKALALDTPVPTPEGWKTMGDLVTGDIVYDEAGCPSRVIAVGPIEDRPCFKVVFDDGSEIVTADTHEWLTLPYLTRRKLSRQQRVGLHLDWRHYWGSAVVQESCQMQRTKHMGHHPEWGIPCSLPLEGSGKGLPVPPYTLGVWLGYGTTVHPAVTQSYGDWSEIGPQIENEGICVRERVSARRKGSSCFGLIKGALHKLRQAGVLGDKHIPADYLRASVTTRLRLLQGLMDTDGFVIKGRREVGIDLTCKRLADDVAELATTFGWKVRRREKAAKLYGRVVGVVYRTRFVPDLPVFTLTRKLQAQPQAASQRSRHTARWVKSVTPIPTVPTRCIQVDSPSHLYLAGRGMVPTHNSFLVSIMTARTLYKLLCLRRPDLFYMLGPGSGIAAVNLSVSKEQARDVVYAEIKARLEYAPWFSSPKKYQAFKYHATFPKKIAVFCQSKNPVISYGYNTFFATLDEACFMLDNEEKSLAEDLSEAVLKSMNTRFPGSYKFCAISTLRDSTDYLCTEIGRIKMNGTRVV